jgi:hypothetical protein
MHVVGVTISGIAGLVLSMTWCHPVGIVTTMSVFGPPNSNGADGEAVPVPVLSPPQDEINDAETAKALT